MTEASDQKELSTKGHHSEDSSDASPPTSRPASEGLPEDFELTPELVEEEAIRGDFVLRWAAVLLAILFGCTLITHTQTLVDVRAGQYLLSHGIVPDGTDPFAYTTAGRVWRNHAWLFDIVLAGVYGIGGAIGLTIFKALLAGVVFWCVVTISRPHTSTWWNAIVAVIGAVACIPFYTARPELITLVGVALLLRTFHAWRYESKPALNWKLPVLFLFWCNMDPRMYLGLAILLVAACGESLRRKVHPDSPQFPRGILWQTVGLCFVAVLINPFGWHSLLSAWDIYAVSDPAARAMTGSFLRQEDLYYFNLMHRGWWESPRIPLIAALIVGGLALISFYLNYTRLNIAHILLWILVAGLAFATGREIGPAVLVCCMIASLNCQDWYRESFSLEYTVRKLELLFSRGGRALTVVSFVAIAYLGIRGYAFEGYQTRIGFGFENVLNNSLSGLKEDLTDTFDNRPFNFTARQGDMLIWTGEQVFIDSRIGLFTGSGENDLIAEHNRAQTAIRLTEDELKRMIELEPSGREVSDAKVWKEIFDKYHLTLALPELTGNNPDYPTYNDLVMSRDSARAESDWQLTHLGPSAATFYRQAVDDPEYQKYLKEHQFNFLKEAFRKQRAEDEELPFERGDFPQPETAYERYLTSRREVIPKQLALAKHYAQYLEQADLDRITMDLPTLTAISCLSIRKCNEALSENPESSLAFSLLGEIYRYLLSIEPSLWKISQTPYDPTLRYMQSMLAFQQALIGNPGNPRMLLRLRDLYLSQNRLQMAREMAIQLQASFATSKDPTIQFSAQDQTANQQLIDELNRKLDPVLEAVSEQEKDENTDPFRLASALASQNFHPEAIRILKAHPELREPGSAPEQMYARFQVEYLWGVCHLETGQLEEAYTTLQKLDPQFDQLRLIDGYLFSSLAATGHADYRRAVSARRSISQIDESRSLLGMLTIAPLVGDPERYNLSRVKSFSDWMFRDREVLIQNIWWIAVLELERGRNDVAAEEFKRILEISPDTSLRPLVVLYLYALTGERPDLYSPQERIPITPDLFTPDPEEANAGTSEKQESNN